MIKTKKLIYDAIILGIESEAEKIHVETDENIKDFVRKEDNKNNKKKKERERLNLSPNPKRPYVVVNNTLIMRAQNS